MEMDSAISRAMERLDAREDPKPVETPEGEPVAAQPAPEAAPIERPKAKVVFDRRLIIAEVGSREDTRYWVVGPPEGKDFGPNGLANILISAARMVAADTACKTFQTPLVWAAMQVLKAAKECEHAEAARVAAGEQAKAQLDAAAKKD